MIQVKHKTVVRITHFFVGLAICLMIVLGLRAIWKEKAVSHHSRKTLGIVIDLEQREKLFEQLKSFAEAYDFDIHIGSTTPEGDAFNIHMSRRDVFLIANNVMDPRGYDFDFYDKYPHNPVSEEIIDSLMNDLKKYINEVPNVRIFD